MSNRCYCTLRHDDFKSPKFKELALHQLADAQADTFAVEQTQLRAWERELDILALVTQAHSDCVIALEYMIPRMGKRVDAVILCNGIVFSVEFKVGEGSYPQAAKDQAADYAFDLKNFHLQSHDRLIVPILVCTEAPHRAVSLKENHDGIFETVLTNDAGLTAAIDATLQALPSQLPLDCDAWLNARYSPTPTIVEAAQALYESNQVEDISRHEADCTDINTTTSCIDAIIESSRANGRKSICFITGVPGAGKTLVGLNIASKRRSCNGVDDRDLAVFLSGNGPLIEVLQASLVEDQSQRDAEACRLCSHRRSKRECRARGCAHYRTKDEIRSEVKTFVQGVHLFREELFISDYPPEEHNAIFDEAQRAWSREQLSRKMKTRWRNRRDNVDKSEPECLIEYMDRLQDWAVMICLVGGGQEIHDGEAGIAEWFAALREKFPWWDVYASPEISGSTYLASSDLSAAAGPVHFEERLHLGVDMRSFRNKRVAAFAEAVVENRPAEAAQLYQEIAANYPVYITRDLGRAKQWVRSQTHRPSDRYGIIAGSHGERIRADGIMVPSTDFDAKTWFLADRSNINSSYFMEIAASEFKIQGLEIDYAVVAWEADYRYHDGEFHYHRFFGDKWQNVTAPMRQRYLANGYRVLLTRARQGFVIYVPTGSEYDPTRPPSWYDGTYEYLRSIGIRELPAEDSGETALYDSESVVYSECEDVEQMEDAVSDKQCASAPRQRGDVADALFAMKNKQFAFACAELLKGSRALDRSLDFLLDERRCKEELDHSWPVLVDVTHMSASERYSATRDASGKMRYYKDTVELGGRMFLLSNDWYYNKSKRDNRTPFVNWLRTQL